MTPDTIEIRRLRVRCQIGVPDEERASPQDLFLTLRLLPREGFARLDDRIERTVDYHRVALEAAALAAERPRRLIETLATELAERLLRDHPLREVTVRVEKHILPDTDFVAVEIVRQA